MKMRKMTKAVMCLGAAWAATAAAAMAQDNGNVAVRDRARPEYDALGVHAGAFTLFPTLDVSAMFSDNIFSAQTGEQDDTIGVIAPSLRLVSNWSVHALALNASAVSRLYDKFDALNSTDWRVGGDGRIDVTRDAQINGGVSYFDGVEPLYENPITGLAAPIEFTQFSGRVGGQWNLARTRVSANVQSDTYSFQNGRLFNNTVVRQDDRDRTITLATGRVDYSVSPDTSVFVSATANWRDYDLNPPAVAVNRNSDGYEVLVGFNFDVTRLVAGDFGVGYLKQKYDQPGAKDDGDFAARGRLQWFPTEILTITAAGARQIGDSELFGTTSYIGTQATLTADYELRRNLLLTAEGGVYSEDYNGVDRKDDRWHAMAGADYMLNRVAVVYVRYSHWDQSSKGVFAGRDYQTNDISIGLRLRR